MGAQVRAALRLICAISILCGAAWAQFARYDGFVAPAGYNFGPATIVVCQAGGSGGPPCTPLALIYNDPAGTSQIQQPFLADMNGRYHFYAPAGLYVTDTYGGGYTTTLTNITLGSSVPSLSGANTWTGAQNNFGQHIFLGVNCNDVVDTSSAIQTALNNASIGATVELPAGVCKISSPITLVSGVSLVGQMPQVQYVAGQAPDLDMIPGNGTWLDCAGQTNCLTGSGLRGTNLHNLGFENFTGQAILIGGNNADGISFADWRGLIVIGSSTINGSDAGLVIYNFQHITWDGISVFHVNTCYHLISQDSTFAGGNSALLEPYCYTYPKSVANSNNAEPGLWLQASKPASGSSQSLDVMSIIRPQVNSFGGDNTGDGIRLDSDHANSAIVNRITIIGADVEGSLLNSISLVGASNNYVGISSGTSSTNGFSVDGFSGNNVLVSYDNNISVNNQAGSANQFIGSFHAQSSPLMAGFYWLPSPWNYSKLVTPTIQFILTSFSGLPTCNSTTWGAMGEIADSPTTTWGATITVGGGTSTVVAFCDGTNWTVAAK